MNLLLQQPNQVAENWSGCGCCLGCCHVLDNGDGLDLAQLQPSVIMIVKNKFPVCAVCEDCTPGTVPVDKSKGSKGRVGDIILPLYCAVSLLAGQKRMHLYLLYNSVDERASMYKTPTYASSDWQQKPYFVQCICFGWHSEAIAFSFLA